MLLNPAKWIKAPLNFNTEKSQKQGLFARKM